MCVCPLPLERCKCLWLAETSPPWNPKIGRYWSGTRSDEWIVPRPPTFPQAETAMIFAKMPMHREYKGNSLQPRLHVGNAYLAAESVQKCTVAHSLGFLGEKMEDWMEWFDNSKNLGSDVTDLHVVSICINLHQVAVPSNHEPLSKRRGQSPPKKKGPVWSCQGAYTNIQTQNPKGHPSHSAVAQEGIVLGLSTNEVSTSRMILSYLKTVRMTTNFTTVLFGDYLRPPKEK